MPLLGGSGLLQRRLPLVIDRRLPLVVIDLVRPSRDLVVRLRRHRPWRRCLLLKWELRMYRRCDGGRYQLGRRNRPLWSRSGMGRHPCKRLGWVILNWLRRNESDRVHIGRIASHEDRGVHIGRGGHDWYLHLVSDVLPHRLVLRRGHHREGLRRLVGR